MLRIKRATKGKKPRILQGILHELLEQLKDKKAVVRANALESLAKVDHPFAVSKLIEALSDSNSVVRWTAALYLGETGKTEAVEHLIDKLSDHFSEVRMRSVEALGILLQDKGKCPSVLTKRLKDPDDLVRIQTAEALGRIGDRKVLPSLWRTIHDRSPLVRSYVAGAIGELGNKVDITKLERELRKEKNDTAKVGYYQALYMLGHREVLSDLFSLLEGRDYRVRSATANTLCEIVDQSNFSIILKTLQRAEKREQTLAAKSSIQSSIRRIRARFRKKRKKG